MLRRVLRCLGLMPVCRWARAVWLDVPVAVPNFLVQRIIGVNRGCPWPVHYTSRVTVPDRTRIHPSVRPSFAQSGGCYIQALNGIEIGEGTVFAWGVKIISANHSLDDYGHWEPAEPIRIGAHCWIGANAVILPGVQLGDRVVVGAGSVVTHSFEGNCVIAGVPARLVRELRCGAPDLAQRSGR